MDQKTGMFVRNAEYTHLLSRFDSNEVSCVVGTKNGTKISVECSVDYQRDKGDGVSGGLLSGRTMRDMNDAAEHQSDA